jgi:polyhydroxyalkanoate synthase
MVDGNMFQVGQNLATTPGQVVFRNELLELIQYRPATDQVRTMPIVIVAPWINKYYILDLNEQKSLIRYLINKGFTVFVTSWKNPTSEMRDTALDDYMLKGALTAVRVANRICGSPVHAVGYCLGGTILAALMAWLNRDPENRPEVREAMPVAHWTLFTTLVDFSNPGDIDVFIDEDSIAVIEQMMSSRGYLDGADLTRSFLMLRTNSLIWHYFVHNYLFGEEPPAFDVLYWSIESAPQAHGREVQDELTDGA